MIRWYALYVRSRWEKKVQRGLSIQSVESFLPLLRELHRWSDRSKYVEEPLFRGYVFVRTDLRNKIEILETDGVSSIVSIHSKPAPIPDEQINWLRILVKHPEAIHRNNNIVVGERVRIIAGPFSGVEGTIVMEKGSAHLAVSIDSIRQSILVDVSSDVLERIDKIIQ